MATTAENARACNSHSAARCHSGARASISRGGLASGTVTRAFDRRFCRANVMAPSGVVTDA